MTREQAKKVLPIIKAFAEGKKVEVCVEFEWIEREHISFESPINSYRIAEEKHLCEDCAKRSDRSCYIEDDVKWNIDCSAIIECSNYKRRGRLCIYCAVDNCIRRKKKMMIDKCMYFVDKEKNDAYIKQIEDTGFVFDTNSNEREWKEGDVLEAKKNTNIEILGVCGKSIICKLENDCGDRDVFIKTIYNLKELGYKLKK